MKAAVVTFPGSNCDRDLAVAFEPALCLVGGARYASDVARFAVRGIFAIKRRTKACRSRQ